jgi:hypothetical protein
MTRVRRSRPVLVLDAMGVLYETGDDVGELLVPFAVRHGSTAAGEEIRQAYLAASYGQIDASSFWERIGVEPAREDDYLAGHRVSPGVGALLDGAGAVFDSVCCLSNDVAAWSLKLRRRHGLDRAIPRWFVSGEIGLRKPDPGIYRHMRISAGRPAAFSSSTIGSPTSTPRAGSACIRSCTIRRGKANRATIHASADWRSFSIPRSSPARLRAGPGAERPHHSEQPNLSRLPCGSWT